MSLNFNFKEIISAFIVLFAIIDITGSIPIIIDLRGKGAKIGLPVLSEQGGWLGCLHRG